MEDQKLNTNSMGRGFVPMSRKAGTETGAVNAKFSTVPVPVRRRRISLFKILTRRRK